jgi:4-alpha-glucanotransferase
MIRNDFENLQTVIKCKLLLIFALMENNESIFRRRSGGVLLHPASLPGQWGIGTFGPEAYAFIDNLSEAGIKLWQILPLTPTGVGHSPYQSCSAFAGNTLLISLQFLHKELMLSQVESPVECYPCCDDHLIDYSKTVEISENFLQNAYQSFKKKGLLQPEYEEFCLTEKWWLENYALFAALRQDMNLISVQEWPTAIKQRNPGAIKEAKTRLSETIGYHKFVQFIFFRQWFRLKTYAGSKGVKIVGDLPIYVSSDSVEVWTQPRLFQLDKELYPLSVAGVPPDYFSEKGQMWGNPLYQWDAHLAEEFKWWHRRIGFAFRMFDLVRIDHFRGFADFWAIPFGKEDASEGTWHQAPGNKLFQGLHKKFKKMPVIAEDLGVLSDSAVQLLEECGFPGMKVLQFAFQNSCENTFLPHHYEKNCVVFTGTHDNNTTRGWFELEASQEERAAVLEYLQCDEEQVVEKLIRLAWSSVTNTVIIPVQDLLNLNSTARMNIPGTTTGNWLWKMTKDDATRFPVNRVKELNRLFCR